MFAECGILGIIGTNKNPPGRIPGNVMRFKIDENLKIVADAMEYPQPIETVAVELCSRLIDAGMIEDPNDHWGESVLLATGPQYAKDVCDVLAKYLCVEYIDTDVFDAFCRLIVMGDGDCPHCGGNLLYDHADGHELNDGDYWTPNSYLEDMFYYRCSYCDEIYKSKTEL